MRYFAGIILAGLLVLWRFFSISSSKYVVPLWWWRSSQVLPFSCREGTASTSKLWKQYNWISMKSFKRILEYFPSILPIFKIKKSEMTSEALFSVSLNEIDCINLILVFFLLSILFFPCVNYARYSHDKRKSLWLVNKKCNACMLQFPRMIKQSQN